MKPSKGVARRLVSMLAVVVALLFPAAAAAPAAAASSPAGVSQAAATTARQTALPLMPAPVPQSSDNTVCQPASAQNPADSTLLSINRWGNVADSFHDRLDASFLNDIFEKVQRRLLFSTMNSFGNSVWQLTSSLTGFAARFCLIDVVGPDADSMASGLGNAMLNSGLVAIIVVAAVVMVLWRTLRSGTGSLKALIRPIGVLGLIALFTFGATASIPSGPGTGSPWWFAAKSDKIISNLASAPVSVLSANSGGVGNIGAGGGAAAKNDGGATSCSNTLKNMGKQYISKFGSGIDNLSAQMPLVMSQMWENTGLAVWIRTQFGTSNPFGQKVFCSVLDDRINQSVGSPGDTPATQDDTGGTRIGLMDAHIKDIKPGSYVYNFSNDAQLQDSAIIGAAACVWNGSWSVDPAWAAIQSGGKAGGGGTKDDEAGQIVAADCQKLWTEETKRNVDDFKSMHMVYQDDPSYISAEAISTNAPEAGNFLLNWHGNDNAAAFVLAITFDIAAVVMLAVFGGIALGIIIGKTMAVVMITLIILAALFSLWPGAGTSRLAQYIKLYMGVTLFVFGISALYALIALVTGYLGKASASLFDAGSLLSILWFAFSPVTAVILLHMLFKHALKMPSPFKLSGAMAWGGAMAGAGAAAGVGMDRMLSRGLRSARSRSAAGIKGTFSSLRGKGKGSGTASRGTGGSSQRMEATDRPAMPAGGTPTPTQTQTGTATQSQAGTARTSGAAENTRQAETGADVGQVPGAGGAGTAAAGAAGAAAGAGAGAGAGATPAAGATPGAAAAPGARGGSDDSPSAGSGIDPTLDPATARRERIDNAAVRLSDKAEARTGKSLPEGATAGALLDRAGNAKARHGDLKSVATRSGLFRDRARLAAAGAVAAGAFVGARAFDAASRRARFRAFEAGSTVNNRLARSKSMAASRARYALAWAKANPAKLAMAAAGSALAISALPVAAAAGAVAGGVAMMAGGAAAHPIIAGALVAGAARHHRRNTAHKDPSAKDRRRAEREALYAREAARGRARGIPSGGEVIVNQGSAGSDPAVNPEPPSGGGGDQRRAPADDAEPAPSTATLPDSGAPTAADVFDGPERANSPAARPVPADARTSGADFPGSESAPPAAAAPAGAAAGSAPVGPGPTSVGAAAGPNPAATNGHAPAASARPAPAAPGEASPATPASALANPSSTAGGRVPVSKPAPATKGQPRPEKTSTAKAPVSSQPPATRPAAPAPKSSTSPTQPRPTWTGAAKTPPPGRNSSNPASPRPAPAPDEKPTASGPPHPVQTQPPRPGSEKHPS